MPLTSLRFARDPRLQKASDNNPPMKRGETGEPVATVQRAFVDLGFDMPVTTGNGRKLADGIFGGETEQVVRQFQKINGLDVDGVVGRQTLKKLEDLTSSQSATQRANIASSTRLTAGQAPTDHRTLRH
jgi:murein L,D-transpeptidase YcbB/YkuD